MKIVEPNIDSIFNIKSSKDFTTKALEVFRYQANYNPVYKKFISLLDIDPTQVHSLDEIPFLPISFFKTHQVTTKPTFDKVFKSSGTTNQERSQHYIYSIDAYEKSFVKSFNHFYQDYSEYTFLALLPSYLEQGDSSLVYMSDYLIKKTQDNGSLFYLNNHEELNEKINQLEAEERNYILLGVSYALLDFKDQYPTAIKSGIVMETGGMKGRREEITKEELHKELAEGYGAEDIHSEYGMTELLSQAYSNGKGIYGCPPWMKVMIRSTTDPFHFENSEVRGLINIIDLANLYSCSFIATDDIGKLNKDGEFNVIGRFDSSEIRGCNLMIR